MPKAVLPLYPKEALGMLKQDTGSRIVLYKPLTLVKSTFPQNPSTILLTDCDKCRTIAIPVT